MPDAKTMFFVNNNEPEIFKFNRIDTLRISQQSEDNIDNATIITELINKLSMRAAA